MFKLVSTYTRYNIIGLYLSNCYLFFDETQFKNLMTRVIPHSRLAKTNQ